SCVSFPVAATNVPLSEAVMIAPVFAVLAARTSARMEGPAPVRCSGIRRRKLFCRRRGHIQPLVREHSHFELLKRQRLGETPTWKVGLFAHYEFRQRRGWLSAQSCWMGRKKSPMLDQTTPGSRPTMSYAR